MYYFNIPPWKSITGKKDDKGNVAWIDPIDNKLNNKIIEKRENIKKHIGNQTYTTERQTKSAITKEMMEELSRRFKKKMTNNASKSKALRTALEKLGIKGLKIKQSPTLL